MISSLLVPGLGMIHHKEMVSQTLEACLKEAEGGKDSGLLGVHIKGMVTGKYLLSLREEAISSPFSFPPPNPVS